MSTKKTLLSQKALRFQVTLPSAWHRKVFNKLSKDQRRSMDAQASTILVEKLLELGYITQEDVRTGTQ